MKKGNSLLLIILILLVCAGLGFGVFYYLNSKDTETDKKENSSTEETKTEEVSVDDFKSTIDNLDLSILTSSLSNFSNQDLLQIAAKNLTKNSTDITKNTFTKKQIEEFVSRYFGGKTLEYTDIAMYGKDDISNNKYVLYNYDSTTEAYSYNKNVSAMGGVNINAIYNNYVDVETSGKDYIVSVNKLIPNVGTMYTDGKNELFDESVLASASVENAIKYFKDNLDKYKEKMPTFKYVFNKEGSNYILKSYTVPDIDLSLFSV